jgi:biotin synthase
MKKAEALEILSSASLNELQYKCSLARNSSFGKSVDLCAIISAKTGGCTEDCAFCSQSGSSDSEMLGLDELHQAHISATEAGIHRFSPVTSGGSPSREEFERICEMAAMGRDLCPLCASLGILDMAMLRELKAAGVSRYHHNLETSMNFFPTICSTHTWRERVETVERAGNAGLSVCSGGIMGIGESDIDRVDLAFSLNELEVDSIALNFYLQVPGATVSASGLTSEKMLRIIALFRLVNPESEVRICAGRAKLEEQAGLIFSFGATGIMTGTLLTTEGTMLEQDIDLISKAGFRA